MGESDRGTASPRLGTVEFEKVCRLARDQFGLDLKRGKEELVAARLGKKMRELRLGSYREYLRHVEQDSSGQALIGLIDALTTNHTSFLRETAHFDFLRREVLPELRRRARVDFWSAACASGEEPYTLAMVLMDALGPGACRQARILATDISMRALDAARRGMYPRDRLEGLPAEWLRRFFRKGTGASSETFQVRPEVAGMVEFRRLNLIQPLPAAGPFSVILCRNVMIYFDRATQQSLVSRLAERLEPGGCLFVGHAESLTGIEHSLNYVRPAIYRKPAGGTPAAGGVRR